MRRSTRATVKQRDLGRARPLEGQGTCGRRGAGGHDVVDEQDALAFHRLSPRSAPGRKAAATFWRRPVLLRPACATVGRTRFSAWITGMPQRRAMVRGPATPIG